MPLGCMLQCRELPWMSRPIVSKLLPFRSSWRKNGQQPDPWQTSSFWALPLTSYRSSHVPVCVVQGRSSKILVQMQLFDCEMEPLRPAIRNDLVCPSVCTPKIFNKVGGTNYTIPCWLKSCLTELFCCCLRKPGVWLRKEALAPF